MNTVFKIFTVIVAMALTSPASAQSMRFNNNLQTLTKINSYKPEQSPKHERSKDVLNDRVIDGTNRVVGEVQDILLSRSGFISMLDVDFDRLKLGTDRLFISYADMGLQPVSNGYKMSYNDDQIEELFPTLLANMATASGDEQENYSVRKIVGATVKAKDGRKLGKVEDVLFDNLGGRAEMLFVKMDYKSLRGEGVAIPFNAAQFGTKGKSITVTMSDSMADAMIAYAEEKD